MLLFAPLSCWSSALLKDRTEQLLGELNVIRDNHTGSVSAAQERIEEGSVDIETESRISFIYPAL